LYASAALDKGTNEIILKLVNTSANAQNSSIVLQTSKKVLPEAKITVLKNAALDGLNTIDNPAAILPVDQKITIKGKNVALSLAPYSLTVVRVKMQ
jgi:alpha-L-arabinofuranosidase